MGEIVPSLSSISYVTLIKLLKLPKFSFIWKVRNIEFQIENNLTKVCFLMALFLLIMYSLLGEYSCSNHPAFSTRTLIYLFSLSISCILITFLATSYVYAFSKIPLFEHLWLNVLTSDLVPFASQCYLTFIPDLDKYSSWQICLDEFKFC